jgi:perosamine synthetase
VGWWVGPIGFPMVPHSRPSLGTEEEEAAVRVIRSGMLSQGREVRELEADLCRFLEAAHVVAVSSGTAALHLALLALGVGPGKSVGVPSYVCAALPQAVHHAGATPLVADIDPISLNLSASSLLDRITPSVAAAIVPHMFGRRADLDGLSGLGVPVVEDCAMALGVTRGGRHAGTLGAAGVLSFYATKVICGGEGGAVVTGDDGLAEAVRDMRDYDGRLDVRPRFNYKLTDLQAAVIRVQLSRLPSFLERRRELGRLYSRELVGTRAHLPGFEEGEFPFRYVVRCPEGAGGPIRALESRGVSARRPVFQPVHRLLGEPDTDFPSSVKAHEECVSLPLYPGLTDEEVRRTIYAAKELL